MGQQNQAADTNICMLTSFANEQTQFFARLQDVDAHFRR